MTIKKKLMVCGCSFSALPLAETYKGTHFSEILAERLGWDLVNNSYRGCSNGGVRVQIDEVIRQKPDFAIIIPTFFDRTEIPVTGLKPDYSKILWTMFDNLLRKINKNSGYDPKRGIENINYANAIDPALVCENINSLVNFPKHFYRKEIELLPEVHQAVKDYVSYLYDPSWKKQQDRWIIEHGALELVLNNIPFIMIPTMSLWQAHMPPKELEKPKILDEKYYIMKREYCPLEVSSMPEYSIDMELDPGYHTTYEGQEYLADKYEQLIKERLNLC